MDKKTPQEKVQEIIEMRDQMTTVKNFVSTKWQAWTDSIEGYEKEDDQGNPIYNNKIEAQFLDTYISKFTGAPELELLPEGKEDRAKVDLIKKLFADTWQREESTHMQQLHLNQAGTLGVSMIHIGVDYIDEKIKKEVVTGVDKDGKEETEEIEISDCRNVIFSDVVDMREAFMFDYPEFNMCTEFIRDTWVDESEWSLKYKNNDLYTNTEDCMPVIKDPSNGTFRYPDEGEESEARYYKITKFFKEPTGDNDGDRYEIMVNDKTLIYEGALPNLSFGKKKKRLPFSLLICKRRGFGYWQSVGLPEQLEQPAIAYNKAIHQFRVASAMSSIGFAWLPEGITLKNEDDKIYAGAMIGSDGPGTPIWSQAPKPGGELLTVADNTYENMVRITGLDPRSSVVAQKVTTAYQRAAEEKAQSERLSQYQAEIDLDLQRQAELIIAAIIQSASQVDVKKTIENMKLKKGHKDRNKVVYKQITLEGVTPLKIDGKTVGVKEKKGASPITIEVTPEMLDFNGTIKVKTGTNRPLYELTDRQIKNEYLQTVLLPMIQASPLLEQKGFDVTALIEQSMMENNISLPKKEQTMEEKVSGVAAKYSPAPSAISSLMKKNAVNNQATSGIETVQATPANANGGTGLEEIIQ